MSEKHIHVPSDTKEVVFREGAAPALQPVQKNSISGNIKAPAILYGQRKHLYKTKDECYVVMDVRKRSIMLCMAAHLLNDVRNLTVNGSIVFNMVDIIDAIFKEKKMSHSQLRELVRKSRLLFQGNDSFTKLMMNFQKFNAKIETELKDENNKRGEQLNMQLHKVTSDVPLDFMLTHELIIGEEKFTFKVEVYFEYAGGELQFWMESFDLEKQIEERVRVILEEEATKFDNTSVIYA